METKRLTVRLDAQDCTDLDVKRGGMSRNEAIIAAIRAWKSEPEKEKDPDNEIVLILREQLNTKDQQIETLQRLIDQQQKLSLASTAALESITGKRGIVAKVKGFFKGEQVK